MLIFVSSYLYLTASFERKFRNLSIIDCSVILWGAFIVISTILSPHKKLAFWGMDGSVGRYTGCFLLLLYIGSYFFITRYYKANIWHMYIFLASGVLMCILGITDFFDMDLLHFKEEIKESQRYIFTSTIGNINTYTSCVAMVMAVFGVFFVSSKNWKQGFLFCVGTVISYVAIVLGESDSAYLSLAVYFGLLPLYSFQIKGGVFRYLILVGSFFTSINGIAFIQSKIDSAFTLSHGLFQVISDSKILPMLTIVIWLSALIIYFAEDNINTKVRQSIILIWGIFILSLCCIFVFFLYDVNIAGNTDRYKGLKEYLLFNDQWGTHRGYIWRIAMENYQKFPLLQKLFGYGPDTFGAITMANNYPEMVEQYSEIFDSVHNEYLQYLITIGPFGLLSYMAIHITAIMSVIKKKLNNPLTIGTLLAVLCYAAQATVNINQPIATPIMWTLLAVCVASL